MRARADILGLVVGVPAFLAVLGVLTALLSPAVLAGLRLAGAGDASLEAVTLRTLEVVAIVLSVALLAVLGGNSRAAWGVPRMGGVGAQLRLGVLAGMLTLVPVCAVLNLAEVRVVRYWLEPDVAWWAGVVASAAGAAFVIALSEELLFRGGLFTLVERAGGSAAALWLTSVVYAAAHFLDAPDTVDAEGVAGAFAVLGHATAAVFRVENVDSFAALLAAGLALGVARLRCGHVALAVGIHAGWVIVIKVFKKYTYILPESPLRGLAGRYDDFIGWTAALALAVLLAVLWWRLAPRRGAQEAPA